jgi:hypothetical protein
MAKINYWVLCEKEQDGTAFPFGPYREEPPDETLPMDERHVWVQLDDQDGYYIWQTWDFLNNGRMHERYRGLSFRSFKFNLVEKTWTVDEPIRVTWQNVRDTRMARLADTDWVVVKYTELGTPLPVEWATWRQDLRDWPATQEAAGFTPEQALENLDFHFDPATKARRIALGLPLEPVPHSPDKAIL